MNLRGIAVLVTVGAATACDSPVRPQTPRVLEVVAIAHNVDQDPDGFTVFINGDSVGIVQTNDVQRFSLTPGAPEVHLSDVAHNCTSRTPQPPPRVLNHDTTRMVFEFDCRRTLANKLLFTSYRDGQWKLYAVRYDGSNLHQVDVGMPVLAASVSPDGSRVLFTSSNNRVYIAAADGSNPTATDITTRNFAVRWSHDGSRFAYVHQNNVYVADLTGTHITQLTNDHHWKTYPAWSPNDDLIAYASDGGIYTVGSAGGLPTLLTAGFTDPNMPAWSTGGWVSFADARASDTSWKIYSINRETGELRKESRSQDEEILPAWSPNGEWLAFMSGRNPVWSVYLQSRDGTVHRRLSDGRYEASQPVFGPSLPE